MVDSRVRQLLFEMSADFYRVHADSFDGTRQNAWDSWQRILSDVHDVAVPTDVLDLGCGNGRFATFLSENGQANISYTGVDTEEQFIDKARQRHPDEHFHVDSIEHALEWPREFDFVVCFGVFHHLPGAQYRSEILNTFRRVLRPGGVAAISLWQPKLLNGFDTKICIDHNISELEDNDFLLGWQGDFSHLRYCHHFDDNEISDLVLQCDLKLVTQFQGAGNDRSNRYIVLQKPAGARVRDLETKAVVDQ